MDISKLSLPTMRTHIKNAKLLKMLDVIEDALGYSIKIMLLAPKDKKSILCSIKKRDDIGYTFFIPDKTFIPSDNTVCHELLHLCRYIEGWPSFYPKFTLPEWQEKIHSLVINILGHCELWKRVNELGFDNEEILDTFEICNQVFDPHYYVHCPQESHSKLRATYLLQVMTSPIDPLVRNEYLALGAQEYPHATNLARKAMEILYSFLPLNPQSCVLALKAVLSELSMPTGNLLHEFPEKVIPDFYHQVRQYFQE